MKVTYKQIYPPQTGFWEDFQQLVDIDGKIRVVQRWIDNEDIHNPTWKLRWKPEESNES